MAEGSVAAAEAIADVGVGVAIGGVGPSTAAAVAGGAEAPAPRGTGGGGTIPSTASAQASAFILTHGVEAAKAGAATGGGGGGGAAAGQLSIQAEHREDKRKVSSSCAKFRLMFERGFSFWSRLTRVSGSRLELSNAGEACDCHGINRPSPFLCRIMLLRGRLLKAGRMRALGESAGHGGTSQELSVSSGAGRVSLFWC